MQLTKIQWRLISYLYQNERKPISEIAKAVKISRTQAEYNVKKLSEEKIIKNVLTRVDYSKLGYPCYIFLLLKLNRFSQLKDFTTSLGESKNCISLGKCFGKYDIFTNLIFRNENEINDYLSIILNNKLIEVSDYLLVKPYLIEFYPLKILDSMTFFKPIPLKTDSSPINLDKESIAILKILGKNANAKIVDIAREVKISPELALYKLESLKKSGILLGTKLHLDMKKLGYNYSGFFIHIKNFSIAKLNKIKSFANQHKMIDGIVLSVTKPNCFLQVFHKTDDELKDVINEVKLLLKDDSFELEVLLMEEEEKVNTLPFL
ncbi:Lrp/AsnC family transcriptional regulator [Candidatus Woesearchaeota archaeon]|nr:Lrp/AsnC family transcriptional regulator [Candidatus Woesearchaeota archaeon]